MRMIVGLGNPEEKFLKNRHNIGWMFLDTLVQNEWKIGYQSLYQETLINNELVILVKPTTFMNNSGKAVKEIADHYKIISPYIFVARDDLDLPFNTLRVKKSKQHGGHNGIKSIMEELSSNRFTQIKFGIGRPENQDPYDYVLSDFTQEEQTQIPNILQYAKQVINHLDNYERMVQFNGKV